MVTSPSTEPLSPASGGYTGESCLGHHKHVTLVYYQACVPPRVAGEGCTHAPWGNMHVTCARLIQFFIQVYKMFDLRTKKTKETERNFTGQHITRQHTMVAYNGKAYDSNSDC